MLGRTVEVIEAPIEVLATTYLVVRDKDFSKAYNQVFSKANVEDGISEKIKIVRLSDLTKDGFGKLSNPTRL